MHLPRSSRAARACMFFVVAAQATSVFAQPIVTKSFVPDPIPSGTHWANFAITLSNPSSSATLDNVSVRDVMPNCLRFPRPPTWTPAGCDTTYGGSGGIEWNVLVSDYVTMGGFTLPPGTFCSATFPVEVLSYPCTNTTDAPQSTQGSGVAASDTLNDTPVTQLVLTEGAGTGDLGNPLNWSGALTNNINLQIPGNLAITNLNNTISGTTFGSLEVDCAGCEISGNPINLNFGFAVNVPGTVSIALDWMLSQDASVNLLAGSPFFTGALNLNGYTLSFFGTGAAVVGGSVGGTISGVGNVYVGGPTLTLSAAPTYTGTVQVRQGHLVVAAPVTQEIDVGETGKLSGQSASYYTVTLSDESSAEVGSANSPATWTESGPFTVNSDTAVVFNFGANNTTHSEISSSAAITFNNGGLIKAKFVATPTEGVTYGPLFLTTGTLTGAPNLAVGCGPNGAVYEAVPVFFLGEGELKVTHTDTISKAGNDNRYEGCP